MVALQILALLTLPALVGHLFYRAFAPTEEQNTLAEVLFLQILAGFLLCGWLSLLLAELGWFSLLHLILLLLFGSAIVVVIRWPQVRRWRWPRPRMDPRALLVLAIVLGAALLFLYPGEWVLGAQDPGVYVAIGASIARSGGIVLHDPWIAALPAQARSLVSSYFAGQWSQLPGFYITDFATGEITPQFLHLYPSWLALFYAVGGLPATLLATPILNLLGLVAFYFFVRRMAGAWPAPVALALLALNPAQLWFARQPNAEVLTLVLFIGGWYLFDRAMRQPARRDLAILAGLALGQVALAKLEFIFLPFLLYGYFLFRYFASPLQPNEKVFLFVYTLLLGHASAHVAWFGRPYLQTFFVSLERSRLLAPTTILLVGLAILIVMLCLYALRKWARRLLSGLALRQAPLSRGLAGLWLLLALYGAVLWPAVTPAYVQIEGMWLYDFERLNFLRLAWYLSPIGLGLAILGVLWWIWRRFTLPTLPFWGALFLQLGFYTHRSMVDPYHFWMMRRYIPLILPCLTMGTALSLWRVRRAPLGRAIRRGGAWLLIGLLLFLAVQADAPFSYRREFSGTIAALNSLAAQVPADRPLLVEQFGKALATPLRYIAGIPAYSLPQPAPFQVRPVQAEAVPWSELWRLLQVWPPDVDAAYLLLHETPMTFYAGFSLTEVDRFALEVWRTEHSYDHLPRDAVLVQSVQRLYRVQRQPEHPAELEVLWDTPVWSEGCITVDVPVPAPSLRLRLLAAGFRPDPLPPAWLTITWQGEQLDAILLDTSWELTEITMDLPPVYQGEAPGLVICSDTWNPQLVGYTDDPRDLGILMKSLVIEETVADE